MIELMFDLRNQHEHPPVRVLLPLILTSSLLPVFQMEDFLVYLVYGFLNVLNPGLGVITLTLVFEMPSNGNGVLEVRAIQSDLLGQCQRLQAFLTCQLRFCTCKLFIKEHRC